MRMKRSDSRDDNAYALAQEGGSNVHHSFGSTPTHGQNSQAAHGIGQFQHNKQAGISE